MDIDKFRKTSYILKRNPNEHITFTTTDQNGRLINVAISQTTMEMDYPQFVEYFNHLFEIKQLIETKYYYQPDDKKQGHMDEIKNKLNIGLNSSKKTEMTNLNATIAPLLPPTTIKVPEVYILARIGACLFHFDLKGEISTEKPDQNLVAGLLSAINLFAEDMGWLHGITHIKAGNMEIRFHKGEFIIVALVSSVELNLGYLVEPILADLASELCDQFENFYREDLAKGNVSGVIDSKMYDTFKEEFEEFITKYRRQVFEIYQKLILTEAMYLDVPPEACAALIHTVSEGKSVVNEMAELMKQYPIIRRAIEKVNTAQKPMWDVFSIPMYEIK